MAPATQGRQTRIRIDARTLVAIAPTTVAAVDQAHDLFEGGGAFETIIGKCADHLSTRPHVIVRRREEVRLAFGRRLAEHRRSLMLKFWARRQPPEDCQ